MSDDRAALIESLIAVGDEFAPMIDAAEGMRADMERRGWSPSAAESVATTYLIGLISKAFTP